MGVDVIVLKTYLIDAIVAESLFRHERIDRFQPFITSTHDSNRIRFAPIITRVSALHAHFERVARSR